MLTEHQAKLIAHTCEQLRPGNWRAQQVLDVLYENRDKPHTFAALIQAAINAALNPAIKSPTGIYLPGKHWDTTQTPALNAPQPRPCEDHDGQDAHTCAPCNADILLGHRPENLRGKKYTKPAKPIAPPEHYKQARQEIRRAQQENKQHHKPKTPHQTHAERPDG